MKILNYLFEEWKDIKRYEGLYQVSNYGRVRSLDRYINWRGTKKFVKGKLLKPAKIKKGYLQVSLCSKWFKIHRLVAEAFIPNPNNLPCVNHKDENPENNIWTNLEWCDWSYNNSYGTRMDKILKTRKINKSYASEKEVFQYDLYGNFIKKYKSTRNAARELNCSSGTISSACNGRYKTAYGYIWKYKKGDA